jgi:hypothetical protein
MSQATARVATRSQLPVGSLRNTAISGLFALLLVGPPSLSAPPKATGTVLKVDPVTTLPGLPVALLVSLPSEVVERAIEQEVSQVSARLHVTSVPSGETFEAAFDDEANIGGGWIDLTLRSSLPHGMVEVQEPLDPPLGPGWFADPRFQQPGTYRLCFEIMTSELGMPEDLWSSEATLVVREPQGIDAKAWTWLRGQAEPKGGWRRISWIDGGIDLIRHLTETYPTSEYARYGVGVFARQRRQFEEWLPKAIELSEGTWLADYYRVRLQSRRASWDFSCGEPPTGPPSAEQTACMARVRADAREQLRLIAGKTASASVRHLSQVTQADEEARDHTAKRQ